MVQAGKSMLWPSQYVVALPCEPSCSPRIRMGGHCRQRNASAGTSPACPQLQMDAWPAQSQFCSSAVLQSCSPAVLVERVNDPRPSAHRCTARCVLSATSKRQADAFDPSTETRRKGVSSTRTLSSPTHLLEISHSPLRNSTLLPALDSDHNPCPHLVRSSSHNVHHHRQDPGCRPHHNPGPANTALLRCQRRAHSVCCKLRLTTTVSRSVPRNKQLADHVLASPENPSSSAPSTTPLSVNNTTAIPQAPP